MLRRHRGFQLFLGLATCFALADTADAASRIRILTKVINPVYVSTGKDGPPVRLIQYQKVKPRLQPSPSDPPRANAQPNFNAQPNPNAPPNPNLKPRPHQHPEPYPFAFDAFDRYPGGSYPNRYPFGYYLGGYRYPFSYPYYDATPRVYGEFPVPLEPLNNGGLVPLYGYPFGYGYGYGFAPYAGLSMWGMGGYGLAGTYGFNGGLYYAGPGLGYRFGPTYPVGIGAVGPGGYYAAGVPGVIGNPYYGATQWPGFVPEFQPVGPIAP